MFRSIKVFKDQDFYWWFKSADGNNLMILMSGLPFFIAPHKQAFRQLLREGEILEQLSMYSQSTPGKPQKYRFI
jgi:hypothetical protein